MADPDLRVVRADDGAVLTEAEWKDSQKAHGANATDVKPAGVYLKLGAADAQKDGVVEKVVNDYNDFCTQENVKTDEVQGDWLNGLAEFLRLPVDEHRAGDDRRHLPDYRAEDAGRQPAGRDRGGLLRAVLLVAVADPPARSPGWRCCCSSWACC